MVITTHKNFLSRKVSFSGFHGQLRHFQVFLLKEKTIGQHKMVYYNFYKAALYTHLDALNLHPISTLHVVSLLLRSSAIY